MAKFKAGDRVVATKSWIDVTVGSEYEVTTALEHGVWIIDDVGDHSFMGNDEVKLAPVAEATGTAATGTLRIEPGKFYKTRDGRKVGPMRVGNGPWFEDDRGFSYYESGKRLAGVYEDEIISEWPTYNTNPAAEVDNPRDEYGAGGGAAGSTAGFTVPLDDEALPPVGGQRDSVPPVAEATSGKDVGELVLTIRIDTSMIDCELDRVAKRLRKLKRKARKLGLVMVFDLAA